MRKLNKQIDRLVSEVAYEATTSQEYRTNLRKLIQRLTLHLTGEVNCHGKRIKK